MRQTRLTVEVALAAGESSKVAAILWIAPIMWMKQLWKALKNALEKRSEALSWHTSLDLRKVSSLASVKHQPLLTSAWELWWKPSNLRARPPTHAKPTHFGNSVKKGKMVATTRICDAERSAKASKIRLWTLWERQQMNSRFASLIEPVEQKSECCRLNRAKLFSKPL